MQRNHDKQKATLDAYDISLSIYEGSGLGRAGEVHQLVTNAVLERLHENGHLSLDSTLQFYDAKAGKFLNGRQVLGHCPVQGCKSEKAYADECDLGHQFAQQDLIAPKSTLTGETPEMRPVQNWYFDLPNFREPLCELTGEMAYEILVNGANPGEMEVQPAPNFTKMYNTANAETLGVTIPDDYEAIAE